MTDYKISTSMDASVSKYKSKMEQAIRIAKRYEDVIRKIKDAALDADNTGVKKAVDTAKRMLADFDNEKADATLDADNSKAIRSIRVTKQQLDKLRNDSANIELNADNSKLTRTIKVAKSQLDRLDKSRVEAILDADNGPMRRKLLVSKTALDNFSRRKAEAKIDVDSTLASAKVERFKQLLRSIPNRVRTRLEVEDGGSTSRAKRLAQILVSIAPIAIPAIASLVPVFFALANAIAVVSGGALGLAGAASIGLGGFAGMALMATSAIKMLQDGTLQASAATRNYTSSFSAFQNQWESIIKQNQTPIFNTMANGIKTATVALREMTPFLSGVAAGTEKASASMLKWAQNSQVAQKFFQMMNTTGVEVFNNLLSAAGRFGNGLVSVFTQLGPLFSWVAQGIDNIAAKFDNWANSQSGQRAIQGFIEYTKTNLPIVGSIFGNVFAGIGNLMKAFAGQSTVIFNALDRMTEKFRNWSETVGNSEGFKKFIDYMNQNGPQLIDLIGNITMLLVNFGVAMAPIASAMLPVINAIVQFVSHLIEAHPIIAQVIGVLAFLGSVFSLLAGPIGIVINVVGFLVETFGVLLGAVGGLSGVMTALGAAFTFLTGPIGIAIAAVLAVVAVIIYLWNTSDTFRNAVIQTWNTISVMIATAIAVIKQWLEQFWLAIQQLWAIVGPVLQLLGQIFMTVFMTVIKVAIDMVIISIQTFWTVIQVVFTAIMAFIQVVITFWRGIFTAFAQFLTGDFTGAWRTMSTMVTSILNILKSFIQNVWNTISSFLLGVLNRITGANFKSWSDIYNTISQKLTAAWGAVSRIWSQITSWISQKVNQARAIVSSGFQNILNAIRTALASAVAAVIAKMAQVVSGVRNGVSQALSAARSFIGGFVRAGIDLIAGMIQGVVSKARDLASAAANAARSALNAAKSALGIHSPSREFKKVGVYSMQGLGMGIDRESSNAISSVLDVAKKMTKSFDPSFNAPSLSSLQSNFGDMGISSQIQYTHKFEIEPNQRVVRIEMDINNDALTSIVNGHNAARNSTFGL
ncbi:phage tail protein [Staphylococcus chromogenes]|uniref:phage tail protein n=1 Tax=Staphylococcus chromogenes TaxID=46126 RepID=UPI003D78DA9C